MSAPTRRPPGWTEADTLPALPLEHPICEDVGQHALTNAGACAYCGEERKAGASRWQYPRRAEVPHDWPDDDMRTVPAALLLGLARAVHHREIVTRRPDTRCTGCRLIARLPDDLQAALRDDSLRGRTT